MEFTVFFFYCGIELVSSTKIFFLVPVPSPKLWYRDNITVHLILFLYVFNFLFIIVIFYSWCPPAKSLYFKKNHFDTVAIMVIKSS